MGKKYARTSEKECIKSIYIKEYEQQKRRNLLVHPVFQCIFNGCLTTQSNSSHPNVLKIVGVSDERSKKHFVLFHRSK